MQPAMLLQRIFYGVVFLCFMQMVNAQTTTPAPTPPPEKKWYENIGIRGYAQFRYNRLHRLLLRYPNN